MPSPTPEAMLPLTPLTLQILLAMAEKPIHGYGVIREVAQRSGGKIALEAGTLYQAIKRLRDEGLIDFAKTPGGDVDRRRRYYRLTALGRKVLRLESERLEDLVALARVKKVLPQESAS